MRVYIVAALCVALAAAYPVMVPMRDGVKLHTAVTVPWFTKDHTRTAVMERSPYGELGIELFALLGIPFGHTAIRQDFRGTHKSEGQFTIWHTEGQDAYDTMRWIAEQKWSNGRVMSIGASADALAIFAQALEKPQWLQSAMIIFAGGNGYDIIYPGGAYQQSLINMWMKMTVPTQADRCIAEIQANEAPNSWWEPLNMTGKYDHVTFPAIFWAGWYDIFLGPQIEGFEIFQKHAQPNVRGRSKMVIDPLGHCQAAMGFFPHKLIFGRTALPILLGIDMFSGRPWTAENVKALTFYVMGSKDNGAAGNYWTTLDDWPAYKATPFYFHADGSLSPKLYPTVANTSFTYDPRNPVPTVGGNNLDLPCGPLDNRNVEAPARPDVLTYTTEPLQEHVAVTGPLRVFLYVSSNATDTDFMAKLTDVYPDGASHLIQDGAVRMRWRDVKTNPRPQLMAPGRIYEVEVCLWNTSYVFSKGHRIRVSISSSNAPRFSVNPNNGLPLNATGPLIVARNTIYQSAQFPSRIELPIVGFDQLPEFPILAPEHSRALDERLIEASLLIASQNERLFPLPKEMKRTLFPGAGKNLRPE